MSAVMQNNWSRQQLWLGMALSAAAAFVLLVTIVLPAEFGKDPTGIGRLLMVRVLSDAARSGYECAVLNSQVQACPFYAKLGFEIEGEPFDEAGIPHRRMRRML